MGTAVAGTTSVPSEPLLHQPSALPFRLRRDRPAGITFLRFQRHEGCPRPRRRRPAIGLATSFALGVGATLAANAPAMASRHVAVVAHQRIAIGPTSQYDLSKGVPLSVRIQAPRGRAFTMTAKVVAAGQRPRWLASPAVIRNTGRQRLTLRIRPATARRLAACRSWRLRIVMRRHAGGVVAQRSVALDPQPPNCGRFFSATTPWNRLLTGSTPIDRLSATLVDDLRRQVDDGFAKRFPRRSTRRATALPSTPSPQTSGASP